MRNWIIGVIGVVVIGFVAFMMLARPAQSPSSTAGNSSQKSQKAEQSQSPSATAQAVSIENFTFMPQTLTVKKGTRVTWTNQDSVRHDIVSEDDSPQKGLSSPLLGKGETYSFSFDTAGTYKYYCVPHASMSSMHATVTVTE
ncbi:MAG TPA: plastocyanin/azurin family copper-binding protein [Candidatus Saccharimonadales bacterium]|nr:plastocyanin/azurin family copper-binding protein [Candidatus Saccharimonadales bacterium]